MSESDLSMPEEMPAAETSEPPKQPRRFRPTTAMRKFAEACCSSETLKDDAARAKEAGVEGDAVRAWRRRAGFEEWLRGEVERRLSTNAWEVWMTVRAQALEGNLQAAKLFLERFGTAPAKRNEDAMPATFHALAELAHLAAQQCSETISC